MIRKFVLTFLLLTVTGTYANAAGDPYLKKAEDWFNSVQTAKADFTQIGFDGRQATGTFYLNRPGRLRFQYDAPLRDFVVADGVLVHFYDGQIGETSNAPIGQTPADFILRKNLDFSSVTSDLIVTKTEHNQNVFRVIMGQREDPESGEIVLDFAKDPMTLLGWAIRDSMGGYTEIDLRNLKTNIKLEPTLFRYVDPDAPARNKQRFNN